MGIWGRVSVFFFYFFVVLSLARYSLFFFLSPPFTRFSCTHPLDEILLSSDKTIAIIDGSGVLADPAGLDREELRRLARARVPVAHFDRAKLGKDGYLLLVEEQDVRLPCK